LIPPLDRYIDMLDSMILWMKIRFFSFVCTLSTFFCYSLGYMNQGGIWGVGAENVCNQGLGGGFWGVNPGFTHFGGLGPVFGVGSFSHKNKQKQEKVKNRKL
jgi:hypothetical protein